MHGGRIPGERLDPEIMLVDQRPMAHHHIGLVSLVVALLPTIAAAAAPPSCGIPARCARWLDGRGPPRPGSLHFGTRVVVLHGARICSIAQSANATGWQPRNSVKNARGLREVEPGRRGAP